MNKHLTIALVSLLLIHPAMAQDYSRLEEIRGKSFRAYHSKGYANRADDISARCNNANAFFSRAFQFQPNFTLLILTEQDWPLFTKFPVYGMPHYNDDSTLVVAAVDNDFWKSFVPPLDQVSADRRAQILQAYGQSGGQLSMAPFFDLLVLHELAHAFHLQGGLQMPRKWMAELFCNLLLHTYISEKEPAHLPALTVFPEMVIGKGTEGYRYTSLTSLEENYNEIGMNHPNNYGWYQSRWHAGARAICDAAAPGFLGKLWKSFRVKQEFPDDSSLAAYLGKHVDPNLAEFIRNW